MSNNNTDLLLLEICVGLLPPPPPSIENESGERESTLNVHLALKYYNL